MKNIWNYINGLLKNIENCIIQRIWKKKNQNIVKWAFIKWPHQKKSWNSSNDRTKIIVFINLLQEKIVNFVKWLCKKILNFIKLIIIKKSENFIKQLEKKIASQILCKKSCKFHKKIAERKWNFAFCIFFHLPFHWKRKCSLMIHFC